MPSGLEQSYARRLQPPLVINGTVPNKYSAHIFASTKDRYFTTRVAQLARAPSPDGLIRSAINPTLAH